MRANNAPMSKGVYRITQLLNMVPFAAGVAVAVWFFNWQGVIGGIVVHAILAHVRDAIQRRLDARAAFAVWGTYLDPGFTGKIKYKTTNKRAPRLTGSREDDDDIFEMDEWLLADGALLDCRKGSKFKETPDPRYLAAQCDKEGKRFTVYDQTGKMIYDYGEVDAPAVFADLFRPEGGKSAAALAAVLGRSEATPLVPWRGLLMREDYLPDLRDDVLQKELAPRLTVTATLAAPADCSTLDEPIDLLMDPVRRLGVNGFPTPYLCENLTDAIGSEDGVCLFVKGCIIDEDFLAAEQRWYYRGRDSAWAALSDTLRDFSGAPVGRLLKIRSLTATSAVFEVDLHTKDAASGYVQASNRAMPFKAAIDVTAVPPTCEVQLAKFA